MNLTLVFIIVGTALILLGLIRCWRLRVERRRQRRDEGDKSLSGREITLREAHPPVKDEEAQQADQLAGLHKAIRRECSRLPDRLKIEGEVWLEGERYLFQLKGVQPPISLSREGIRLPVGLGGPPRFTTVEYRPRQDQRRDNLETGLAILAGPTPWLAVLYLDLVFTIGMCSMPEKR